MATKTGAKMISAAEFLEQRTTYLISMWAETGFGKSSFILSAPPPIYIMSLEPKSLKPALDRAIALGVIKPDEVFIDEVIRNALMSNGDAPPMVRTLEEQQVVYDYMNDEVAGILSLPEAAGGTIGYDTMTEFWQMCDEVESEEILEKRRQQKKDLYRFDYQYANKALKSIVDNIASSDMNGVFTHHARPVYNSKGEEQKGRFEFHGNRSLHKWVDILFRLRVEVNEDDDGEVELERWGVVEKCRLDQRLLGEEFDSPTWDSVVELMTPTEWE